MGPEVINLISGVPDSYYNEMGVIIDTLTGRDANSDSDYKEAKLVVANYVYLVYERLELNVVRDIDYEQVKTWASENKKITTLLLRKEWPAFSLVAFDKWISHDIDILKYSMYSRSNYFNKNIYH